MRGLSGKVVVIAGGGSGLGAATAARLGAEGAKVVIGDLVPDAAEARAKEIEASGGDAIGLGFDITDAAQVDALFKAAEDTYGGVDGVHVNAGDLSPDTIGRDTDLLDVDLAVFDRTIAVNLRGHVVVTKRALPQLIERGGALVYTSSAAAFVGEPERPSYAVSKNGLHGIVRHVASRWGRQGVRANAVAPGLVLTPTIQEGLDDTFREMALSVGRSPRLGQPDDIASAVAFLLSDDAGWINGQVLSVDGGAVLR